MALGDSTLGLNIGLPSFSPTPGYPSFDLHRHVALVCAVQDGLPPFDHRLLQPGLYVHRLLDVTLDDTSSWHTSTRTVPGSLSLRVHRRACVSSNTLTDRVPKVPKGCF